MLYDTRSNLLLTDAGRVLKRLDCPLRKALPDLDSNPECESGLSCNACSQEILDLAKLSEKDATAILEKDPQRCVVIRHAEERITLLSGADDEKAREVLPVIGTARGRDAINAGAMAGFRPLVKRVQPSEKITSKLAVYQNRRSGEVWFSGDFRDGPPGPNPDEWDLVIPMFWYYPYAFEEPVAAYLLPADLKPGQAVVLEDLIEDLQGVAWNQGDCSRLEATIAVWNGEDFEFHSEDNVPVMVG